MTTVLGWVCLSCVALAHAGDAISQQQSGPLSIRIDCDRLATPQGDARRVGLEESIALSVTVVAPPTVTMRWPSPVEQWSGFGVDSVHVEGPDSVGRFVAQRWFLRLRPERLGRHELDRLVVDYRESAEKDWVSLDLELPAVEVVEGPTPMAPTAAVPVEPATVEGKDRVRWSLARTLRYVGTVLLTVVLIAAAVSWYSGQRTGPRHGLRQLDQLESTLGENNAATGIQSIVAVVDDYLRRVYGTNATVLAAGREPSWMATMTGEQRSALVEFAVAAEAVSGERTVTPEECRTVLRRARAFLRGETARL